VVCRIYTNAAIAYIAKGQLNEASQCVGQALAYAHHPFPVFNFVHDGSTTICLGCVQVMVWHCVHGSIFNCVKDITNRLLLRCSVIVVHHYQHPRHPHPRQHQHPPPWHHHHHHPQHRLQQ
jgi:hypothetical protein